MRFSTIILLSVAASSAALAIAADSVNAPRPVPLTRPEMKQALEDMKGRTQRIPLPELSDADKEKLGDRATSYESRLRYHYMPGGDSDSRGGRSSRDQEPAMTLDYAFKVQLFWIVSRTNNCQY